MFNYEFEKEIREKAKIVAKHIKAILKVGKQNAMHRDDILLQLEHHGLPFALEEYLFRDAFLYLDRDIKRGPESSMYYIRKSKEAQDGEW